MTIANLPEAYGKMTTEQLFDQLFSGSDLCGGCAAAVNELYERCKKAGLIEK